MDPGRLGFGVRLQEKRTLPGFGRFLNRWLKSEGIFEYKAFFCLSNLLLVSKVDMTMKQNNKIRYDLLSFTDLKKMETWLNNESLLMTYIPQVPQFLELQSCVKVYFSFHNKLSRWEGFIRTSADLPSANRKYMNMKDKSEMLSNMKTFHE